MVIKNGPLYRVQSYMILALIGWTVIASIMIWINWGWMQNHILEIAQAEARASIDKDILYREWNASHGGVYVPVTEKTQPNPYLDVPERDITTTSGKLLTLINPAYMTHQVYEMQEATGIRAHITSLNPINLNNKADTWEVQVLQSFENGGTEVNSVELINRKEYMRLMRPFIIQQDCLKCHASQGYKVGDIRGGLSVSVPMSNYAKTEQASSRIIFTGYGTLWLIGLAAIYITSKDLKKRFQEREEMIASVQKSREEYHTILRTAMDGFWQVDLEGNLLEVNDAYCQMSGYGREELLQMKISDLDINEKTVEIKEHIETVVANVTDRFETVHRRKDESTFDVEVSVHYLEVGSKKIFAFLRDITEQKLAHEAQQKAKKNYIDLVQTVEGIVWEADAQTFEFSFVSEQAERLLGYPTHQWLDDPGFWANHIHPDDREGTVNFCVAQTQAMRGHEFEYRMIASDKKVVWLRDVVSVIVENGQPVKLRGIMLDITGKKTSEEKLHQLSLAVEQNPASVVITDLDGNITYVNPKFTQITGYTLDEVIGKNPRILKSSETSREEYKELWQTITSGKVWHSELHNKKKNGELFWEDVMISPLTDNIGRITHFVAVKEDISERKRSEKEIFEKNADLAALFSISAHLRTALSANEMLPLVLQEMGKVLNADANAVILLEPDTNNFIYVLGDGLLASNTGLRFPAENSISGIVMQTREAYVTQCFANDPHRTRSIQNYEDIGSTILVPLQSESEFIGVLLSARHMDSLNGEFSFTEIQLLKSIGEMVGNALRRAKLYDQALARLQRVQALRSIDAAINANMDSTVTLRILINQTLTLLNVDAAAVLLYDPNTHILEYAAAHGFRYKDIENAHLKLGHGLAKIAITEHRLIKIPDLALSHDPIYKEIASKEGFVSCYVSPMIAKGQVCGLLEVYSRTALTPNQEWLDFLESLGAQAAIAIDNAQLFINLEKSNLELSLAYDATIAGWSHALDLKDKETEGHTLRVTSWTIELAKSAGLSDADIIHIRRGALLHDIGKMGIPDNILNKAGELTPEEWDMMRQHPQFAYNMIYPIEFLHLALDIPYCHHEKWDGTGYPRGLKNLQIPYAARLFAIIDVWDALTCDRSYRKAWSHKKTITFIKLQSGKHFDPDIVNLFMEMMDDADKDSWQK